MTITYERFVFFLLWTIGTVIITLLISTSCSQSAWERDAIRNRVATYSEDTGRFQWLKPCAEETP